MLILVAFEESQTITNALRAKGHKAYSCDLQECSGGNPQWHIKGDALAAIASRKWDMIILHPPCTYTALCGNRWYHNSPLRQQGIDLCKSAWELACSVCDRVALEQPKTIMQKYIGPKTQVIHPWMFGHKEYKETWLWIKGLPLLKETSNVLKWMVADDRSKYEKVFRMPPSADRGKLRSKTYQGLANAIADQWA
jgi:hypothetical protein